MQVLLLRHQFDEMTELRREFDALNVRQEELRSQYKPANIHARLRISTSKAEEYSEGVAESFLDGRWRVCSLLRGNMNLPDDRRPYFLGVIAYGINAF